MVTFFPNWRDALLFKKYFFSYLKESEITRNQMNKNEKQMYHVFMYILHFKHL